jgi:hypothetical protein
MGLWAGLGFENIETHILAGIKRVNQAVIQNTTRVEVYLGAVEEHDVAKILRRVEILDPSCSQT